MPNSPNSQLFFFAKFNPTPILTGVTTWAPLIISARVHPPIGIGLQTRHQRKPRCVWPPLLTYNTHRVPGRNLASELCTVASKSIHPIQLACGHFTKLRNFRLVTSRDLFFTLPHLFKYIDGNLLLVSRNTSAYCCFEPRLRVLCLKNTDRTGFSDLRVQVLWNILERQDRYHYRKKLVLIRFVKIN